MRVIFILFLFIALPAVATDKKPPAPTLEQSQTQGQGQAQSQSQLATAIAQQAQALESTQNVTTSTGDQSVNVEGDTLESSVSVGDQISNLSLRYEAAAASAAAMNLAYCADGNSAQGLKGGFGVGQVNFVCESVMVIKVLLAAAPAEIAQAKECHDSKDEETRKLAQGHLDRAHGYFLAIDQRVNDVNGYIETRAKTANIGAASRDLSLPLLIIALLLTL